MDMNGLIENRKVTNEATVIAWASEWIEKPESAPQVRAITPTSKPKQTVPVAKEWDVTECLSMANAKIVARNCGQDERERADRICRRMVSVVNDDCQKAGVSFESIVKSCTEHSCSCLRMPEVCSAE